jgi:uncharacterized protein
MQFKNGDILSSLANNVLHLILLPTEACNFRCIYCYEDFKYKRMEPWVVRGVKSFMERRASELSSLTLSWFGGEPLLATDLIEEIMLEANRLQGGHPTMRLTSNMTTNGYTLSRTLLERLLELGVTDFQISFDGPRAMHDRKRVLAGGKGTFDRIWGNLLAARAVSGEFTITVRVHVDQDNEGSIPEFIDEYASCFGDDPRFDLFIRGLSRLGGPNDSNLAILEGESGAEVLDRLREGARSRGLRLAEAKQGVPICYASRANSFVVRANGRLNKCTVALEHPGNQVGMLREDGTVALDAARMSMWMRGLKSENPAELSCPMVGYADSEPAEIRKGPAPIRLSLAT